MYVGICISDTHVVAGILNQEDEVILVKDENSLDENSYGIPLAVYVEDHFAYIGSALEDLQVNDLSLVYAKDFLKTAKDKDSVHTDPSGNSWTEAEVLAVLLKKIETDIQVYHDHPIQGVIVTLTQQINHAITATITEAFHLASLPLCGIVPLEKAVVWGYQLEEDNILEQNAVLHCHMDHTRATLQGITDQHLAFFEIDTTLGIEIVYEAVAHVILQRYESITGEAIKSQGKYKTRLHALAKEVVTTYKNDPKPFQYVVVPFDVVVTLTITKQQIEQLLSEYVHKVFTCLATHCTTAGIALGAQSTVLITGLFSGFQHLVGSYLEQLYGHQGVPLYFENTDQVLIKGVTRYANNHASREIAMALHPEIDEIEGYETWEAKQERISSTYINAGVEA